MERGRGGDSGAQDTGLISCQNIEQRREKEGEQEGNTGEKH